MRAARLEAAQAQAALGEVLAARRGAREALRDMAAQNARLVVAYCTKKAELKRLQDSLAAERQQWEVSSFRMTQSLRRMLGGFGDVCLHMNPPHVTYAHLKGCAH